MRIGMIVMSEHEKILAVTTADAIDAIPLLSTKNVIFISSREVATENICRLIVDKHIIVDRSDETENDSSILQVIPYIIFVTSSGYVFLYKRGGESSEKRLSNKNSIGIGGHINVDDKKLDTLRTICSCASRECLEEIGFIPNQFNACSTDVDLIERHCIGILYDPTNSVGSVHLGLVIKVTVDRMFSIPEQSEIYKKGTAYSWMRISQAKSQDDLNEYETWTDLILKNRECI
jgi:predicted NUDIX family phosphoesterase